ncbi:hypothetical protein [Kribbella italica]|uniref:Uncharacterized protein n=1 Tax=Kribbella italica TaxID=1540520 RepID=A0A7W9J792_9ACTN|nr:hypothetical protein [Kribbella italica]MBB5836412.1 hypothetical protein [Kribbella italica]
MQIAYFWERDDAEAVAERLGGELSRGRFHGEDDDEDHPWVVALPEGAELAVVDEFDGWLEPAADEPAPAPPPLPTAPKRLKKG